MIGTRVVVGSLIDAEARQPRGGRYQRAGLMRKFWIEDKLLLC